MYRKLNDGDIVLIQGKLVNKNNQYEIEIQELEKIRKRDRDVIKILKG